MAINIVFAFNTSLSNESNLENVSRFEINNTSEKKVQENSSFYQNNNLKDIKVTGNEVKFEKFTSKKFNNISPSDYAIVRFNKNPSSSEIESLKIEGLEIIEFLGSNTYYAKFSREFNEIFEVVDGYLKLRSENIDNQYLIKNVVKNNFKLTNHLKRTYIDNNKSNTNQIIKANIPFQDDIEIMEAKKLVRENGRAVVGSFYETNGLLTEFPVKVLSDLASIDQIKKIEETSVNITKSLDNSKDIIRASSLISSPYELKDDGIKVLVYEETSPFYHFRDRFSVNNSFSSFSNHPTFVTGIIIGNGSVTENYSGVAPNSEVISYEYNFVFLNVDISNNYKSAINNGVSLASNSWRSLVNNFLLCYKLGDYSSRTELFDEIVFDNNTSIPIIFAAGNDAGLSYCSTNGYDTIAPEASGKNTISVGNVNKKDLSIVNDSSRGPTNGGLIKPEMVAHLVVTIIPLE